MIKVKIKKWVEVFGLRQTSMIWELAYDPEFQNIFHTKVDDINLDYFSYDIDVPLNVMYYLRGRRQLNNGDKEVITSTIVIESTDVVRSNVILERDLLIDIPSVYVNENDIKYEDYINVKTSSFRANNDQHSYTNWLLMDNLDNVLWSSLKNTDNLTEINIPNIGQPYTNKSKLKFIAIHGSKLGRESGMGNISVFNKNVNFELLTNLVNVKALTDLQLVFKKIDPNKPLGIAKIVVYNSSNEIIKTYTDVEEKNTIINWWIFEYGADVKMVIHCNDLDGNILSINKYITVESFRNNVVPNPDVRFKKELSNYYTSDVDDNRDFFIPNNYSVSYIHNGSIPIPKSGSNKLFGYQLDPDNKLQLLGEINGITIDNNDTKEGILIKKINNDILLLSNNESIEGGKTIHTMSFYKHVTTNDSYKLIKKITIEDEEYGLGYNNAFIQYDNTCAYYIPYKTDKLKKLDLNSLGVSVITEDIPYIKCIKDTDLNNIHARRISPIILRLSDDRLLIMGGYGPNSVVYSHSSNTFQESIFWDNVSYIANELNGVNLINGDGIIVKKENIDNGIEDDSDSIYNDSDFVIIKTLEEIYKEVNETPDIPQTVFNTDLEEYEVLAGNDLVINIESNLTPGDDRQYYVVLDKQVFRVDSKNLNSITLHCYNSAIKGKRKVKLIASKDQVFDPDTFNHFNNFTNSVVIKEISINVSVNEEIVPDEGVIGYYDTRLTPNEAESIFILGNKYKYNSQDLNIKCYKESEIRIPVELANVSFEVLEIINQNKIPGFKIDINKRTENLFELILSNFEKYDDIRLTIKNTLRDAEFITLIITFVDIPVKGLPEKVKINRSDTVFNNYSTLSYFDLITYSIDFITSNRINKIYTNNEDYVNISNGTGPNNYNMSMRVKKLFPIFIKSEEYPIDIYNNNYFYINSVNAVPALNVGDPNIDLIVNKTIKAVLVNDFSGFDKNSNNDGYEIIIEQNILSKNLLDITVEGTSLQLTTKSVLGNSYFDLTIKNKIDNSLKKTRFMFTVYEEDSYPDGYIWKFENSTGKNNEKLYLLPGSENNFTYTNNGNKVELDYISGQDIFNTDATSTSLDDSKLVMTSNKDLGKGVVGLKFFNKSDIEITNNTKNVYLVPIVFYVKDQVIGDTPVDKYDFTVLNGEEKSFLIYPKMSPGYTLTSINVNKCSSSTTDIDYTGVKYYLKQIDGDVYELVINTPEKDTDVFYDFFISYTYANSNGNDIQTVTQDTAQIFRINSKYYMEEVYINFTNNRYKIYVGETKKLSFKTNANAIRLISSEDRVLSVDNDSMSITGIKESSASVAVMAGSPDQIQTSDVIFVDIIKQQDDSDFDQGYVNIIPDPIKVFPNTKQEITIRTNATSLEITTEDPTIATYDSIRKEVVGVKEGNTRLKVVYNGVGIKGGTKYFDIKVFGLPDGDPDILYYDSFNHNLLPTKVTFKNGYPKSFLVDRSGKVVLSNYSKVDPSNEDSEYRTHYTTFI